MTLVGATTENPSFELNAALLSRAQVLVLHRLGHAALGELLASFGLRVKQAQNLAVLITVMGSAQPVAAALDYAELAEVVGTVAGDNTVLIVCPDSRRAGALCERLRMLIG